MPTEHVHVDTQTPLAYKSLIGVSTAVATASTLR